MQLCYQSISGKEFDFPERRDTSIPIKRTFNLTLNPVTLTRLTAKFPEKHHFSKVPVLSIRNINFRHHLKTTHLVILRLTPIFHGLSQPHTCQHKRLSHLICTHYGVDVKT
jgi:hypothetical protein